MDLPVKGCRFCGEPARYDFHSRAVLCPDCREFFRVPAGAERAAILERYPGLGLRMADWPFPRKRKG